MIPGEVQQGFPLLFWNRSNGSNLVIHVHWVMSHLNLITCNRDKKDQTK